MLFLHPLTQMHPRDISGRGDHVREAVEREGIGEEFKKRVIDSTISALTGKSVINDVVSLIL